MVFCARGLEDLTVAHGSLDAIEPETDLQDVLRLVRAHADGAQPRNRADASPAPGADLGQLLEEEDDSDGGSD